jgi:hypothetical protein
MEETTQRLPYEPPSIKKVNLVKDELAVAGCKTTSVSVLGPTIGKCSASMCKATAS